VAEGDAIPSGSGHRGRRWRQILSREREETGPRLVLVCVLILLIIILALVLPEGAAGRSVMTVFFGLALIVAVWASRVPGRLLRIVASIVGLMVIVAVLAVVLGDGGTTANVIVATLLITGMPITIVVGLRDERTVNVQTVFAALSLYLLIGLLFAYLITIVTLVSSTPYFAQGTDGTLSQRVYFSYVTVASLGYGDLTPATNVGRLFSVLEAIFGSLFLVTVVSLAVSRVGLDSSARKST
jgi:Ion channel